jgi:hypothetical protein
MTENRKTIVMIIFATILAVSALVYGFSVIPTPAQQRELKLDHKRVSDLGEIQFSIDEYYRNSHRLPASLDELTTNTYYASKELGKTDPETKQSYEYSIVSEKTYQLCATFTTDSEKEMDYYDSENYNYSSFKAKFKHPKGRYCFDLDAPVVYTQPTAAPLPTYYMLQPKTSEAKPTSN